jgi:two-component system chemotaxis sensor kinase CheA
MSLDWNALHQAVTGVVPVAPQAVPEPADARSANDGDVAAVVNQGGARPRRSADRPGNQRRPVGATPRRQRDNSIRVDTSRLDQVLNLSGEIGLTKNRLTMRCARHPRRQERHRNAACARRWP